MGSRVDPQEVDVTKQELKAQWRQHPVTRELIEFITGQHRAAERNLIAAAMGPATERAVGAVAGQMAALEWVRDYIASDPPAEEEAPEEDE
jgi:hypothetical protein